MTWHKTISGKVLILLALVFAFQTFDKVQAVNSGEKPCLAAFDGFGYYMYLPHFFQKGHLNIEREWAQELQDNYCWGAHVYQMEKRDLNAEIDIYHMGVSFTLLPSYSVAEVWARLGGYKTDGFSYPYHVMYLLNAFIFIFLGLLYLRKLLRQFVSERATLITLVIIALGTNTYFIFNFQYDLPHLYLFTINAACLYHLVRYTRENELKHLYFSALLFGLAVCIRPTELLFGIIPLILLMQKFGPSTQLVKRLSVFGIAVLFCNLPQLLYWKLVGGQWVILNLHTEDIVLTDPNLIDFLVSYRKGWLLYSPVFLILIFGFLRLFKDNKSLFWGIGIFSLLYIYVMSSWECWWYANSFGQRVMVDIYPILAIPIALLIDHIRKIHWRILTGIFIASCIALNLFQSRQMNLGILDTQRMTKEHYWHIFGILDPSKIHHRFLLIDRGNPDWPEQLSEFTDLPYILKEREVFRLKSPLLARPHQDVSIDKIHLYDAFETDETRLEVPIIYRTSDSTQSALLRMECVSAYNCYSWNNTELSLGKRQGIDIRDTLRFNLPDIRHQADSMQIYVSNPGSATIHLKHMRIIGTSLIRN
jgi:hypothetical protein